MESERKICYKKEHLINYYYLLHAGEDESRKRQHVGHRVSNAFQPFLLSSQVPGAAASFGSLATHRSSSSEAILSSVGHGKLALPDVGIMLAFRLQFVAPGEKPVRRDTGISLSNRHRLLG